MVKEKINICLVNTPYSFFLYLLINGFNEEDIFIFTFLFPKEVSKNVKHIQLPHVLFIDGPKMAPLNSINGIIENILGYIRYFYGYLKLRIILFIKTFNKEVYVYGHAQTPFSYMFYENKHSNIIEDGLMNYTYDIHETHKINPVIDKFLHLCGIYFLSVTEALGTHKNIEKVYLTQKYDNPLINDKIEHVDIEKTWNALNKQEQDKILKIFNINPDRFNFKGKTALLLTQPLTEDSIAFKDEIQMYREMINKFKDYNIIIKPHPREENRDYKKIFGDIEVIDRFFPIELLNLIDVKPTVVCSVVSTALLNFKDSKIYVYEGNLKNKRLNEARDILISLIEEE